MIRATRTLRTHPAMLTARFLVVALLGLTGCLLLYVATHEINLDKPPDVVAAQHAIYVFLGLAPLTTAGVLAWFTGPSWRWLALAAATLALAPPAAFTVLAIEHGGILELSEDAAGIALVLLVLAAVDAGIVYPGSRFSRVHWYWAAAWLGAWMALLLVIVALAFLQEGLRYHEPYWVVTSTVLLVLAAGCGAMVGWALRIARRSRGHITDC